MNERPPFSPRVRALLDGEVDEGDLRQVARRELRTRMRALRNLVPAPLVAARSNATCDRVDAMAELARARVILGYSAIRNEIDPTLLLQRALARGKTVALPRVDAEGALRVLRYRGEPMHPDAFGVPAPDPSAEELAPSAIDVVLVPALAVDPRGHRLGYGRGYYDRLLQQAPAAVAIALIHPFQLVTELADMPGDVAVSWMATETGVVSATRD